MPVVRSTEHMSYAEAGELSSLASSDEACSKSFVYLGIKRLFDIVFSLCVIVVVFIPAVILSLVIAVDTKGFPIYSEIRASKRGKAFRIFKFRTMHADSGDIEKYFTADQLEAWQRERKVKNDPRITKLGMFLRATSLDEIPQFVNVLLGQMSVVGPRAITFDELRWFGEDKELLLSFAPGITGSWQTGPRNQATFSSGLRQKTELDYVKNASLKLDAILFFRTFRTIFKKTGE